MIKPLWACLSAGLILLGCSQPGTQQEPTPQAGAAPSTVYFGGDILTMDGSEPAYVEAVVESSGTIVFTGSKADAIAAAGANRQLRDLDGATLLPGFIDAHGHAYMAGIQKLSANLLPPPDGDGRDIDALVRLLTEFHADNEASVTKVGWIVGFGYDDSQLAEKRHPTADDLDRVSTSLPVLIIHQSGHLAVMNHKALEMVGYTADSPDPTGGVLRREADGRTPNGVLEEMAFFQAVFGLMGNIDSAGQERIALAGVEAYAQFGFTTAQEGRATKDAVETWRKLASEGRLTIDIAAYPDLQAETEFMLGTGDNDAYENHFRIAGVKLSFDGSPQGKTAWLSEPYVVPPPGQSATYTGYPAIPEAAERARLVDLAYQNDWQLLVHCNGDAASDAMIDAVQQAAERHGNDDRRSVMVHSQTVREDQLDRMADLGIVPSFFTMHTYYWGDWHRDETLGPERANHISPTRSALDRNMRFTTHHDAPVALPSAIVILHTTVNRTSRSGQLIGADQRVSPYIGLKALTEWAAWQYFEEDLKGTLAPGKLADFVILDQNPLKVAPETIWDIAVLETIKEGNTVYRR